MLFSLELVTLLGFGGKQNSGSSHRGVFLTAHFISLLFAVSGTCTTKTNSARLLQTLFYPFLSLPLWWLEDQMFLESSKYYFFFKLFCLIESLLNLISPFLCLLYLWEGTHQVVSLTKTTLLMSNSRLWCVFLRCSSIACAASLLKADLEDWYV